ncbi:hypothetical protein RBB50_007565 [Rhinocladiella similis]
MASPSGPPAIRVEGGEDRGGKDHPKPVLKVEAGHRGAAPLPTPGMSIRSNNNDSDHRVGPAQQPYHLLPADHLSEYHLQAQMLGHQDGKREAAKQDQENLPPSQSQRDYPAQSRSLEPHWFHGPSPSMCHPYGGAAPGRLQGYKGQFDSYAHSDIKSIMKDAGPVMNPRLQTGALKLHPNHGHAAIQQLQAINTIWQPLQFHSEEAKRLNINFTEYARRKYLAQRPHAFEDAHIHGSIVRVLSWMQQYYPGTEVLNQRAFGNVAEACWRNKQPFGLRMSMSTIATRRDPASLNEQQSQLDGVGVQFENQGQPSKPQPTASQINAVAKYRSGLCEYYSRSRAGQGHSLIPYQPPQSAPESATQRKDISRPGGFFEELGYNLAYWGKHQSGHQTSYPGQVDTGLPQDQNLVRSNHGPTTLTPDFNVVHHEEFCANETEHRSIARRNLQDNYLVGRKASHAQNRAAKLPGQLDEPCTGNSQAVGASPAETDVTEYPCLFSEEDQPKPKEHNVLRMLAKQQVLPARFRRVLSANIVKKVLFLALHGIPSAAIAYEIQGEFPKPANLRVNDRIERIETAIDHYLLQMMAEMEREGDPNDFICKLLSHAASNDWIPRSLHNAIEYIYSETIEGALTGSEERKEAAKARTALHKWRCDHDGTDPNPSAVGKRTSDHGSSPKAKRRKNAAGNHQITMACRGLEREKKDHQHLAELGYREGDDDHEKVVMSEWLESIKQKKRLPSLLEAADLIRGD